MRFGVNYVPSKKWWYCWNDWNSKEIHDDLFAIKSIGCDHIRIQCLWSYFQPNENYISEVMLDRLHELLDIADKADLDVEVTVLDGWLSGFLFIPPWATGNIFTTESIVEGEKKLFVSIVDKIGQHKRFMGFDLGNELSVLNLLHKGFTVEEGDKWQKEMFLHVNKIAPNKMHTNGVDHVPWFNNAAFSRNELAQQGDVTAIHCWTEFTGALAKYGPLGTGSLHISDYMIELAKAYNNRQIWVQEFGTTTHWMSQEDTLVFTEQTIKNIFTCDNVWGITWWCSHNINEKLKGFNDLEYNMGLLDINNNLKPIGAVYKKLIEDYRRGEYQPIERDFEIELNEQSFEGAYTPEKLTGWDLANEYMKAIDNGKHPKIVMYRKIL